SDGARIGHVRIAECWPGGPRRVGHAAPDDVDEVLMHRERSVGSRPNLELAQREVAGLREQVWGGVALPVPLLAVALRTVLEVELLARLSLRLGADVLSRHAHRSRRRGQPQGNQDHETRARTDG